MLGTPLVLCGYEKVPNLQIVDRSAGGGGNTCMILVRTDFINFLSVYSPGLRQHVSRTRCLDVMLLPLLAICHCVEPPPTLKTAQVRSRYSYFPETDTTYGTASSSSSSHHISLRFEKTYLAH